MNFSPDFFFIVALFIWVLGLTIILSQYYFKYNRFFKSSNKDSMLSLLKQVAEQEEKNKKTLDQLIDVYAKLEKDGLAHIQKIGLVRFNPFKDTGGDQSFILALVDAENTGVVISSLHTRTGTRWYAKTVISGHGVEYDLSEDEQKALKGAKSMGSKV